MGKNAKDFEVDPKFTGHLQWKTRLLSNTAISLIWSVREKERPFLDLISISVFVCVVKPKPLVKITSLADVFCTELDIFGEDEKIHAKFFIWTPNGILSTSRQYGIIMI